MGVKLQGRSFASFSFLLLLAGVLPAHAQTPAADAPPEPSMVRVCDESGCSYRPRNAVSTETVMPEREDPSIVKLKQIAESNPKAAYDLGLRYYRGDGLRQDGYQALLWMRKAGEQGNLKAQKALGAFYLYGLQETGADPQEAEKWLSMAVSRDGDPETKQLLDQARAAKQAEQADYKARQDRREERRAEVYSSYWRSGYTYFGAWNPSGWRGY